MARRRRSAGDGQDPEQWGGHIAFPLWPLVDQFWRFVTTHDVFYLARGVTVIAYLLLLIPIWRSARFRATRDEDVVYVCAIFVMPLLSSVLYSVGRFGLVAFPLAFALADLGLRRVTFHRAYVRVCARPSSSCCWRRRRSATGRREW